MRVVGWQHPLAKRKTFLIQLAGVLVPATAVARESAATVSLFLAMVADDDALVTALILCCCCAGYEYSSLFCLL